MELSGPITDRCLLVGPFFNLRWQGSHHGQFEDRGHSKVAIYSSSDQDYDFGGWEDMASYGHLTANAVWALRHILLFISHILPT